jgi:hypothetical protein
MSRPPIMSFELAFGQIQRITDTCAINLQENADK